MTSYTSQGQTVDRVIVHVPAKDQSNSELVNQRFAYVALSRARIDAQVFTNDASTLAERLGRDVSKTAAVKQEHVRQTGHLAPKEGTKECRSRHRYEWLRTDSPFLRPIEPLILDADISEIMVNGHDRVFIERRVTWSPFPDSPSPKNL